MTRFEDALLKNKDMVAAMIAKENAEASAYLAEAEERKQKARSERAGARVAEIMLDREQEKRQLEKVSDFRVRVYRFSSEVGASSVEKCMATLSAWSRIDPGCDITLVLNSPGGEIINGMALFDFIQGLRRAGHQVTTKSLGYAASMAGVLLQAGSTRVMAKESWLLIHEGSMGVIGDMAQVEDRVEWSKRLRERILDIFAERATLSKATIGRRWHRKDWWLSSDEALEHGFCDLVE